MDSIFIFSDPSLVQFSLVSLSRGTSPTKTWHGEVAGNGSEGINSIVTLMW